MKLKTHIALRANETCRVEITRITTGIVEHSCEVYSGMNDINLLLEPGVYKLQMGDHIENFSVHSFGLPKLIEPIITHGEFEECLKTIADERDAVMLRAYNYFSKLNLDGEGKNILFDIKKLLS